MKQLWSEPVDWVGKENLGFVINAEFSQPNASVLQAWFTGLSQVAPVGVYCMPPNALHITVLDWVAPLLDYDGIDKRKLYQQLYATYDAAFETITTTTQPFTVCFDELRVTAGTILLVGHDDGQFAALRQRFLDQVELPAGGKQPPTIVHSSLARFVEPAISLEAVQQYVDDYPLVMNQQINDFRLVETRREPMQDFEVIKTYPLATI